MDEREHDCADHWSLRDLPGMYGLRHVPICLRTRRSCSGAASQAPYERWPGVATVSEERMLSGVDLFLEIII